MKIEHIDRMVGGWFVGDFEPHVLHSTACEVALKRYAAGTHEARHVHKIAHEVTLLVSGSARMNTRMLEAGDIVRLEPGEPTDFLAFTDCVCVVVKSPSAPSDKHPA